LLGIFTIIVAESGVSICFSRRGRMNWKEYFEAKRGKGFLATAGKTGEVDIAVYSRPHVMADDTLAFGMTERLTHTNLQENPYAVYAFNEKGLFGKRWRALCWKRFESGQMRWCAPEPEIS
jgi:hypothetical protein